MLDDKILLLRQVYNIRDVAHVYAFLRENPSIIEHLMDAAAGLRHSFYGSTFFLEVAHDSELPSESRINVYIATRLDLNEAAKRLLSFEEDWLIELSPDDQRKMSLNLEVPVFSA